MGLNRPHIRATCWKYLEERIKLEPTGNLKERKNVDHMEANGRQWSDNSLKRMNGSQGDRTEYNDDILWTLYAPPRSKKIDDDDD